MSEARPLADAARGLLMKGDAAGAERVLKPVFRDLKSEVDVLHLMSLIKKAQGDLGEAERLLRAAISADLKEGAFYNELGTLVQARGGTEEAARLYRAAIVLLGEDSHNAYINLVRCLLALGDLSGAEIEARTFVARFPTADAWSVLSQVQTAMQRFDEAADSAAQAYSLAPDRRQLRHNLAVALERAGDSAGALEQLEALTSDGIDTPDLAVSLARALQAHGRAEEAESILADAAKHWPTAIAVHSSLARMRWARGDHDGAGAELEEAVKRNPEDVSLRLACADVLTRTQKLSRAETILSDGLMRAPDHPALLSSMGVVLDEANRVREALLFLKRAAALTPGVVQTHRNLVPTLLRGNEAEEALDIVRMMLKRMPDDQELIAYEAMALRMLGDPLYRTLYDFDRLVKTYDIPAPRGYFTIDNFNAGLSESLAPLFKASKSSMDQNVRNGIQTQSSLLATRDVNIDAFLTAMETPLRDYVENLIAHPQDPVGRRKGPRLNYMSCWATRLDTRGFHMNHVHPSGWISATYYVALPNLSNEAEQRAGWLKLGEPRYATPGCTPERYIEPKEGKLVVYPSYMWHGTIPFSGAGKRVAISFEIGPA